MVNALQIPSGENHESWQMCLEHDKKLKSQRL